MDDQSRVSQLQKVSRSWPPLYRHDIDFFGIGGAGSVMLASLLAIGSAVCWTLSAQASHQGHERHAEEENLDTLGTGHHIPGAPFQVFLAERKFGGEGAAFEPGHFDAAVQTVIQAFSLMMQHRSDYPRFDESLQKNALSAVIIEPRLTNRDGKEFAFLVARTKAPSRVKLLISASALKEKKYLGRPERLVPDLAREFQWVVSKSDTTPKSKPNRMDRDLATAPIRTDQTIAAMPAQQRVEAIQRLFDTYLRTVDDRQSLAGQPFYEVQSADLVQPAQPDSTTMLYDIRVRQALQKIVGDPYFWEHTPKAVRSLLNGKVWSVTFAKIDQRDWATRTRVAPDEQAVVVGAEQHRIQPATILINTYRQAAPDDPFYAETKGLPMGALSADQLARVIAWEIQQNIIEKSMRGHVAQDAMTAPSE